MSRQIITRKISDQNFTVTVDGRTRKGFVSTADVREWVGNLQAHGMFPGYILYEESETGALTPLEPTYKDPCHTPAIIRGL